MSIGLALGKQEQNRIGRRTHRPLTHDVIRSVNLPLHLAWLHPKVSQWLTVTSQR